MSTVICITMLLTFLLILSSPTPSLSINFTLPLLNAHNFSIFSYLLSETDLDNDLQEVTSGITMLIPSDQAFFHLSKAGYDRYHKFTISDKYIFGQAHIIPAYYTLRDLQISKIFMQPTVASIDLGLNTFLVNISGINGSVHIDTGIVRAVITRTLYDHRPNVIYAVSKVLLFPEVFGNNYVDAHRAPSSGFYDGPLQGHSHTPVSSAVAPLSMLIISPCLSLLLLFVFY
jgi:hypothetical protein